MTVYNLRTLKSIHTEIVSIEGAQAEVGNLFICSKVWPDLANNNSASFLLATGTSEVEMQIQLDCEGNAEFRMYEDLEIDGSGGSVTPRNFNRQIGDNANFITVYSDPLVTADSFGTLILEDYIMSGEGQKSEGGANAQDVEFTLKTDSLYYLQIINTAGSAKAIVMDIEVFQKKTE